MSDRLRDRLDSLGRALDRLDQALAVPPDAPLAIDGTIQRFEFTFELMWKALKDALATEGVQEQTPRSVLRATFGIGWLDDEAAWLGMLEDRNLSSHVYREEVAAEIYGRIRVSAPRLRETYDTLRSNLGDSRP